MRILFFFLIFISIISCDQKKVLSAKEKHDLVKNGMSMQEVMDIYGLKDTNNRSIVMGECGYEFDSLTNEMIVGRNGLSPMISLKVDSNYNFDFTNGKVMGKISFDEIQNQKKDTSLQKILKSIKF